MSTIKLNHVPLLESAVNSHSFREGKFLRAISSTFDVPASMMVGSTAVVGVGRILHRGGLLQDCAPDLLSDMGRDRSDEQSSTPDPVQDEVGVHTDVSGDLAIPIADALEIVEPIKLFEILAIFPEICRYIQLRK